MADRKPSETVNQTRSFDEKHDDQSHNSDEEVQRNASATPEVIRPHAGVTKVEAFNAMLRKSGRSGKTLLWVLGISIGLTMFAYSIDQGTTYLFLPIAASSFKGHSSIAAISTAAQIIRSISKPFLAKIADITSRPTTYSIVLVFYAIGFAVAAGGNGIATYTVGTCFTAFGKSGLDLLGDIIVADLTNLRWRGFYGSLLSLPFIVTSFIDGFISEGFLPDNWRWGLGMFAIMVPVLLVPAIVTLYYMEFKAKKSGMVSLGASGLARRGEVERQDSVNWLKLAYQGTIDVDLLGLLLLGFAFGLILLSLTLYKTADGGFSNPSMIAMLVIGCVLLVVFALYETYLAPKPCCSRRILVNRAFIAALGVDVTIQLASGVHGIYYPSFILVGKNWGYYVTTIFNNTVTLTLCILGPICGLYLAKFHRFKALMVWGSVLKLIGFGIQLNGSRATLNTTALVFAQLLSGMGSFAVVGARVGSQASVAHEDLASIIAQLSLWSSLGASVGSAIAGAVWQNTMFEYMVEECPATTPRATLIKIYGSITSLRAYPYDSTIRQCAISAYTRTNGILFAASVGICVVSLLFCFLMPNYYLGDKHNMKTNKDVEGKEIVDPIPEVDRSTKGALWKFWYMGAPY